MTLPVVFTANGPSGYNLTNSLRFRSSATAYLNRTPASAGNRQIWTWSGWVKLGSLSVSRQFFGTTGGSTQDALVFNADNQLVVFSDNASQTLLRTAQLFRDPSAWYHVVVAVDTTQATSSNRVKVYVNGVQVTTFEYTQYPSQNFQGSINNNVIHYISTYDGSAWAYDGYLAEVNFVNAQQLTPSSFGETSSTTGVWIPKKYSGSYGTNGFYLPFTDNSALTTSSNVGLGKDFSGNGNYWTTNNISITAGSTYDSMTDVPTLTSATVANYATFNPLNSANNGTLGGANLNIDSNSGSASAQTTAGTMSMKSGKYYFEYTRVQLSNGMYFGIIRDDIFISGGNVGLSVGEYGYFVEGSGTLYVNGSTTSSWITAFAQGNTAMVAYDADTGKVWLGRNGVWGGSGDPAAGTNPAATVNSFASYGYVSYVRVIGGGSPAVEQGAINFGQRPFAYTPPTGFVRLNTFNLPTPTIGATASTTANKYMDATLYTGNGSTQTITNSGSMQPDWVWLKSRSNATDNELIDAVRGATKSLVSNSTAAEATDTNGLTAFNSNGFSLGTDANYNGSTRTYVAWQWRASNATAVTNTAGSITSTVSANTTAGFSIVTYTGTGSNATVGHGLGVAPSMYIVKSRSLGTNWPTYHIGLTSASYRLFLDLTNAQGADLAWNNTAPTSTVFSIGPTGYSVNNSGATYVAYCFAPIAGYSAFGSYTGNGSTDGPFIFTGFRPRYVLIKTSSAGTNGWQIRDTSRSPYNTSLQLLYADTSGAEISSAGNDFDILSNGFKVRNSGGDLNTNGGTYIYMAFCESPFKFSNAR